MKLKGLTKLALSGVALAAVAATLGTSTYAWYISNTTATVSGVSGTTAGADTSGSLYAASPSMYEQGKWSNTVRLASGTSTEVAAHTKDFITPSALNPVTIASDSLTSAYNTAAKTSINPTAGSFVDKAGTVIDDGSEAFTFSFYLIQRGDTPKLVTPTLTITNNTASGDIKKQTVYAANGHLPGAGLALKGQFAVDAVHALRVKLTNSAAYSGTKKDDNDKTIVDPAKKLGDVVYAADQMATSYTTPSGFVAEGSGEANLYYNDVVSGANLYGCSQTASAGLSTSVAAPNEAWAGFYLAPETPTLLTFTVWLEGTDAGCFDSCVNQSFDFSFSFELGQ